MEPWTSDAITINGDLSYAIKRGEINNSYVDIEIVAYSDRWSNFDAEIEFRERDGESWKDDMQIMFSTANTIDKNRLRGLSCSSTGGLNLIRWRYSKNGIKYGKSSQVRVKILPKYINFSTSNASWIISNNSGINTSEFLDSSSKLKPININQSGKILALTSNSIQLHESLSSPAIYTYSGLSNPSFAMQILNGNYFIADTNNNLVLEISEDFGSLIDSFSVSSPIFLDYLEEIDTLLVTSSTGTIYEYIRGSFNLVWTSSTSFNNLTSATYSKKDFNRIIASDIGDNSIKVIDRANDLIQPYYGFLYSNGESDSFVNPHIAIELEDGLIIVVEKSGRRTTFEEYVSSSSSSIDSSSTSSESTQTFSSSSTSFEPSSSSSTSSFGYSESSSTSSFGYSESSSTSSLEYSSSSSSVQYSTSSSSSNRGIIEREVDSLGIYTSIAEVNSKPAIAYHDDTNLTLKYAIGTDSDGEGSWSTYTIDSDGYAGRYPSLAVVDNKPAISYIGFDFNLMYSISSNADGSSSWSKYTVDNIGNTGVFSSLEVVDGKPAIAYHNNTNFDIKYAISSNADGTSSWSIYTIDSTVSDGPSLAVVDGKPAIAYINRDNGLKYAISSNADGTGSWSIYTVDFWVHSNLVFLDISLAVINGKPAIAYYYSSGSTNRIKYAISSNADGTGSWSTYDIDNPGVPSGSGIYLQIKLLSVNGKPSICYQVSPSFGSKVRYARSSNADGTGSWSIYTVKDDSSFYYSSMALINNKPAISYNNTELYYIRSGDENGESW